jgi:heme/copper-type cytochrome/quinol oxidase subunit 2
MTARDAGVEPTAAASPEARRRFLTLAGLFLAGPSIWMVHFLVVYLLAEALCAADVDAEIGSLPALSVVTLVLTLVAVAGAALTTVLAFRRWRRAAGDAPVDDGHQGSASSGEHDAELALAGLLLGTFFIVAILFVGLPAAILDPCAG